VAVSLLDPIGTKIYINTTSNTDINTDTRGSPFHVYIIEVWRCDIALQMKRNVNSFIDFDIYVLLAIPQWESKLQEM